MAKRILLITQWFDPEPTSKGLVFARALVQKGFQVEVLTGFPNYPGGKIYPGYKIKPCTKETIDGIMITRVALFPSHDRNAIKRALNYLSFFLSALVYGLFFAGKPCVIYAYHPPLTVGMAAVLIRLIRRSPVVCDIQDLWPDTLRATGMLSNKFVLYFISILCKWVYRNSDEIVVLSPGFKKRLVERGVPSDKIHLIFNWSAEISVNGFDRKSYLQKMKQPLFHVLFAGNIGTAQALDSVLEAAKLIASRDNRIHITFVGDGVDLIRIKEVSGNLELTNISFVPRVPMNEVGCLLEEADALLVHLRRDPLFEITIPSKTQAYMAAGKAIIMCVDGDAADIIKDAQCGVIAESESPKSIAESIIQIKNMQEGERIRLGKNGKKYYQENMSLRVGVEKFNQIFRQLALKMK
jgi:colanic acid biosynthesis glycosyl transferase WcaI